MFHPCFRSLLFVAAGLFIAQANAASSTLGPIADAFVSSTNPANNYGGAGSFAVSAPGSAKGEFQSLLRFDLAPATASFNAAYGAGNWTLASATLRLTAANPNNALFNASAAGGISAFWIQNDAWGEGSGTPMTPGATGVTWNTLPSFLSSSDESLGAFSFAGSTSGSISVALVPSPGLRSDAVAGALASIHLAAADSTVSGLFNSRSFANVDSRPTLTLNAVLVPEPTPGSLAGAVVVLSFLLPRDPVNRVKRSRDI